MTDKKNREKIIRKLIVKSTPFGLGVPFFPSEFQPKKKKKRKFAKEEMENNRKLESIISEKCRSFSSVAFHPCSTFETFRSLFSSQLEVLFQDHKTDSKQSCSIEIHRPVQNYTDKARLVVVCSVSNLMSVIALGVARLSYTNSVNRDCPPRAEGDWTGQLHCSSVHRQGCAIPHFAVLLFFGGIVVFFVSVRRRSVVRAIEQQRESQGPFVFSLIMGTHYIDWNGVSDFDSLSPFEGRFRKQKTVTGESGSKILDDSPRHT
ncbi:hypothetical protein NPIL_267171 [Nephila pilipes]|uniref:Uncharacterized protein n=1 Tax=Nephila pilipes TaxID=299642 RepID=A0A8X6MPW2_NEPPI|nr:hypothetical protein NPIL_267171 [Nephila pilipes]